MLLIKNASQLLTLHGGIRRGSYDLGIIENGAVLIDGDRIVEVGETGELKGSSEQEIDASGRVVMPGFVDPHTHLVFAGTRENELYLKLQGYSYLEILKMGGGILRTVRATRNATKEELMYEMRRRLDYMLRNGTTTAEAKSGYGLNFETEKKMLEVINEVEHPMDLVPTFLGAHAVPPEFNNGGEYIEYLKSIIPEIAPYAKFIDVFCEKGVFSAEESMEYLEEGKKYGLVPKIHADEIEDIGCTRVAVDVGAISADHLVKTSEESLENMRRSEIIATLLPATPYMLLSKEYAPARKFIDAEIPVALATDLNPNAYTESMQMVISLAITQMRMLPEEAIAASTINAAAAIGMESEIGSIEPGKQADIIIMDAKNYQQIGYHFGVNLVDKVIKKGRIVWRKGDDILHT
ncbi:imidazolonepropionase [Aciduliprofundum sp. MAR08-339]|uniref:imidazolonepropionase n=1 Tax=Aciduliprofundum sp. (strain MAR08-339) TaxID=673860 RepID=UPI0002A49DF8|nr:imidazolonepropionase [Aciduliprofundum sp. MAR08-339]